MQHSRLLIAASISFALAACAGHFPGTTTAPVPAAGLASLFPSGATIIDSKPLDNTTAVLVTLSGAPPRPSVPPGPPDAELAIASNTPAGWRVDKAVIQQFAQAPLLTVEQVAGVPAAGMAYRTGANSQGMVVIRNQAVVYDAVADSVQLQDLNGDGSAEVVKSWSPFCGSHAASPRLDTVYAWQGGQYVEATSHFANVIAKDTANFQAAIARANSAQTTAAWTPTAKACLHDSLAYLAGLSGNPVQAAAERAQVSQLDPSYDVLAVSKAAAGEPAQTMPFPTQG